jgi:hypothetical protein
VPRIELLRRRIRPIRQQNAHLMVALAVRYVEAAGCPNRTRPQSNSPSGDGGAAYDEPVACARRE